MPTYKAERDGYATCDTNINRPRIVFLISRFLDGGIDTVLVDYLQALSDSGKYQLTLAIEQYMDKLEVFLQNVPKSVAVCHLVESSKLMKWRQSKITQRLSLPVKMYDEGILTPIRRYIIKKELKRLAAQNDVIIDFDCCSYSLLKGIETKKLVWFHFSFDEMLKQNRRRMLRIGHYLEDYDKVVTISHAMYQEGVRLFPLLKDKLCVIYNAKNREQLLQSAQVPTGDSRINQPYFLAVERLEESQKDLATLLHAYQLLLHKYHHQELLYLLGKGQSEGELRQLATELGIADHVVFLGFHANPYPWMRQARLLAHSAKLEGLPTVLIEGLMLDKLIVATDCPTGPREILDEGRAGLLVPVGDAEAMAEAIHQLLTDTALQANIIKNVVQNRQQFMKENTIRKFDRIIEEILRP